MRTIVLLFVIILCTFLKGHGRRINIPNRQEAIRFQQKIVKAIRQKAHQINRLTTQNVNLTAACRTTSLQEITTFKENKASRHKNFLPKENEKKKSQTFPRNTLSLKTRKYASFNEQKITNKQNIAVTRVNWLKPTNSFMSNTHARLKKTGNSNAKIGAKDNQGNLKSEKVLTSPQKSFTTTEEKFSDFKDKKYMEEVFKSNVSDVLLELTVAHALEDRFGQHMLSQIHDNQYMWQKAEKLIIDNVADTQTSRKSKGENRLKNSGNEEEVHLKSGRRYLFGVYLTSVDGMRDHMIHLMRDMIYDAQDRMKALNPILKKYSANVRFQFGYTFSIIETLRNDIRMLWTQLRRNFYWAVVRGWSSKMPFHSARVSRHIIYYTYIFRKYMDTNYMIEQMCDKYENHVQYKRQSLNKKRVKEIEDLAKTPDPFVG